MELSEEGREKVRQTVLKTIEARKKVQELSLPFIRECEKDAPAECCVVCWEMNRYCLDWDHPRGRRIDPIYKIRLCASCHRIYDKGGGLEELHERRGRLLDWNRAWLDAYNSTRDSLPVGGAV